MPTSQKRIQVLLRPKVLEVVEEMAADERMPASKILVMLIEEALIHRGVDVSTWIPPTLRKAEEQGREHSTVSRNLKAEGTPELTEKDLKLLEVLKMLKEI